MEHPEQKEKAKDQKVEETKEETKEENKDDKKEEKKEETKKENKDDKKEEKKEEDSDHPKVENTETKQKEYPIPEPKEPEPKIPTNITKEIEELTKLKAEGNDWIKTDLDKAISKYEDGYNKAREYMTKYNKERDYNTQVIDLEKIKKQIISNLALSYFKKEKYQECIDLDISIISIDSFYDKSYARLFKCYLALKNPETAVYFGNMIKNGFTEETKEKYKDLITQVDEESKKIQTKIDEINAKNRKEMFKSVMKYGIPFVILIIAGLYYFFVIKKKNAVAEPTVSATTNTTTTEPVE